MVALNGVSGALSVGSWARLCSVDNALGRPRRVWREGIVMAVPISDAVCHKRSAAHHVAHDVGDALHRIDGGGKLGGAAAD
jgi:hypothetical protein